MHLSNADREILAAIRDNSGECLQSLVVSSLLPSINNAYVYSRIRRMEAGGLVEKVGPDKEVSVKLTVAGKAALREA